VTEAPKNAKGTPRTTKRERLFALAEKNYEPRKATRWPYLLRGERQYRFEGPDRRDLRADLRALWRERNPGENTPSDADLNSVIDDLRQMAGKANPDAPTAEERAEQALAAQGISEIPQDRGLSLVTRLEDSPLPDGYVIPEPYVVAPDGVHLMRRRGRVYPRRLVVAVPRSRLRRPGRRPAGRAGLAGRPHVGLPTHPPGGHQERAQARQRGGRRRAAGHRGRG